MAGTRKTVSVPADYLPGLFLYIWQLCGRMKKQLDIFSFAGGE